MSIRDLSELAEEFRVLQNLPSVEPQDLIVPRKLFGEWAARIENAIRNSIGEEIPVRGEGTDD